MTHYITTHDSEGKAVFRTSANARHVHQIPGGTLELIASTHEVPVNIASEADVKSFDDDSVNLFPPENPLCPPAGTAAAIVGLSPNSSSMWHRTMTYDCLVVLEGDVELHLDGDQVRTLRAGDSMIQRATMHQWNNVTPNDGWVKMACFTVPIKQPLSVAGKKLEMAMTTNRST